MLARLKGVFQRPMLEADLLRVIEYRIKTPPMPQDWLDALAKIRAKSDGGSLTDLWRHEFRADIKSIAGEATWALQRARVIRRIAESYGWNALSAATKEAINKEAWLDHFKAAFPKAEAASPETCEFLVMQRCILALCTEACLVEIGQALYNVNQLKMLELQVIESGHMETQSLQVRVHDRMLEMSKNDPELRAALFDWHDEHCVPLLNDEWRFLDALEEAVVSDSFDVEKAQRQGAEFRAKLAAVLQHMPVRVDDADQ